MTTTTTTTTTTTAARLKEAMEKESLKTRMMLASVVSFPEHDWSPDALEVGFCAISGAARSRLAAAIRVKITPEAILALDEASKAVIIAACEAGKKVAAEKMRKDALRYVRLHSELVEDWLAGNPLHLRTWVRRSGKWRLQLGTEGTLLDSIKTAFPGVPTLQTTTALRGGADGDAAVFNGGAEWASKIRREMSR